MSTKTKILYDFSKMKDIAAGYVGRRQWEYALKTIFVASGFMYTMNQVQCDAELEHMTGEIAVQNLPEPHDGERDSRTVLFYDGLGNVNRGLIGIYLKALHSLGFSVKYVTREQYRQNTNTTWQSDGSDQMFFVTGSSYLEQMHALGQIVEDTQAGIAFLYMPPDDVVAVGVFSLYKDRMQRYLINLTDHAFWIGRNACDVVINFRKFGCKVCESRRDMDKARLVYLPYYPREIRENFQGEPFEDTGCRFIFSGGSLYKTVSKDHQYSHLIEKILERHPDINFVYLGDGQAKDIRKLIRKYPNRIYLSGERTDFFEIMKRCTLYLSTYPYNGGLMTQYALLAGKVPVTLHCRGIDTELSIRNEESFWNYDTFEDCVEETDRLLDNSSYRQTRERELRRFLITSEQFEEELKFILENHRSFRDDAVNDIEFDGFCEIPAANYTGIRYDRLFFRRGCVFMLRFFPKRYLAGAVEMMREKINRK